MRALLVPALFFVFACDGLVAVGAQIEGGAIAGEAFSARTAFHIVEDNTTVVVISDYPDLCERLNENPEQVRGLRTLSFAFAHVNALDGDVLEPSPQDYMIGQENGPIASAEFLNLDDECNFEDARIAQAGFIELRSHDGDFVNAGFDVTLEAEQIRGAFTSERCDISEGELTRTQDSCGD